MVGENGDDDCWGHVDQVNGHDRDHHCRFAQEQVIGFDYLMGEMKVVVQQHTMKDEAAVILDAAVDVVDVMVDDCSSPMVCLKNYLYLLMTQLAVVAVVGHSSLILIVKNGPSLMDDCLVNGHWVLVAAYPDDSESMDSPVVIEVNVAIDFVAMLTVFVATIHSHANVSKMDNCYWHYCPGYLGLELTEVMNRRVPHDILEVKSDRCTWDFLLGYRLNIVSLNWLEAVHQFLAHGILCLVAEEFRHISEGVHCISWREPMGHMVRALSVDVEIH